MSGEFSTEELIAALLEARLDSNEDNNPAAKTMRELVALTGQAETTIARRIRELMEHGRVICVRKRFERIDGVRSVKPAYVLVERPMEGTENDVDE